MLLKDAVENCKKNQKKLVLMPYDCWKDFEKARESPKKDCWGTLEWIVLSFSVFLYYITYTVLQMFTQFGLFIL